MQPDLPMTNDVARRLSLKNVTVGEAREKMIEFLTARWQQSLITLAQKLIQEQRFSEHEALELLMEHINDEPLMSLVRDVTRMGDLIKADAQATLYAPHHFLATHDAPVTDGQRRKDDEAANRADPGTSRQSQGQCEPLRE